MFRYNKTRTSSRTQSLTVVFFSAVIMFPVISTEPLHGQEIQWSNKRILPKMQSMAVPLKYRNQHLGETISRIHVSGNVEVQKNAIDISLKHILKTEFYQRLISIKAKESGYISLSVLKRHGFNFGYDSTEVALKFYPTLDQLVAKDIALRNRISRTISQNAATPSDFSASLNMFFGVDYISQTSNGDTGISNPRVDLESSMRFKGVVLENEATVEGGDKSFDKNTAGFKRRGTRLVKDFRSRSIRAMAGDVSPLFTSFQNGTDLLGVSVEHNVTKLNPGRDIRQTSRRTFRIERDSDVRIFVNGKLMRSRRLQAGDYNINDLPGTAGANEIKLVVKDDLGHEQVLNFSSFLDNKLLSPEISEWSLSGGVVARTKDGAPDYTENPALTGYYRRGINEFMTGEVHLQGDMDTVMGGGGLLYGTRYGLVNAEAALSFAAGADVGYALRFDYAVAKNLLNSYDGHYNRSLRFSAEYRSPFFSTVTADEPEDDQQLTLSLGYGQELFYDISSSISANYTMTDDGNNYGASLSLSKSFGPFWDAGVSFGYSHDDTPTTKGEEDEFNAQLRVSYRINRNSRISANHDVANGSSRVTYNHSEGRGVGAWGLSLSAENNLENEDAAGSSSVNAAVNYTANRARYSASHTTQLAGLGSEMKENRTSMRMETAIAYAGGRVAVGRPVNGSFAIIAPHDSIKDKSVLINPVDGSVQAYSDWMGPVLVPGISAYSTSRVTYDVDGLPVGYDLGAGAFDFVAPYKAGYSLIVGSNYTITAFGTMLDKNGEPVKLLTGIAWRKSEPSRKVTIFTNSVGRFGAQGMAPGKWTIEMATDPLTRYELLVPEKTVGLFKAGTLRPIK